MSGLELDPCKMTPWDRIWYRCLIHGTWAPEPEGLCALAYAWTRIAELEAEVERTRQAWVDGEDPMCEDVCQIECKGPCGVGEELP